MSSKLNSITSVASLLTMAVAGATLTACATPATHMAGMTHAAEMHKMADGSCGAAKPAEMNKMADGSCGAAKPSDMNKIADGSCGEGKCGAAK